MLSFCVASNIINIVTIFQNSRVIAIRKYAYFGMLEFFS